MRVVAQVSNSFTFSYQAPSVTSVSPTNGPTQGNINVTFFGSSFGLSGVVTFNGLSIPVIDRSHTYLTIVLPAGVGTPSVVVMVSDVASSPFVEASHIFPANHHQRVAQY